MMGVAAGRMCVLFKKNLSKHSEGDTICCLKSAGCIADCLLVSIPN